MRGKDPVISGMHRKRVRSQNKYSLYKIMRFQDGTPPPGIQASMAI